MIIGLTGGIGSGKSTVAQLFAKENDFSVYYADVEAKKLMNASSEIREKLVSAFGQETYLNGSLNREYLSNLVFSNPDKLAVLNSIVHPVVRQHFKNFVQNVATHFVIYENAILFESKSNEYCDLIISVFTDVETRISRVQKRDQVTKKEVLNRMNNQFKEEKKLLQSHYVIYNNELEDTETQVRNICKKLTKKLRFV